MAQPARQARARPAKTTTRPIALSSRQVRCSMNFMWCRGHDRFRSALLRGLESPSEFADDNVEDRREYQAEYRYAQHPEEHRRPKRLAHLRAGTAGNHQRHDAEDEREARH